jgi:dTDP-4-dehydrorhamnose 3,5-epimerase
MIQGVKTKKLRVIADERGMLMEILRSDDEIFKKFGQVYVTTAYPGVTKAWHYHKKQFDNMCCIRGMLKLVLYDARKGSKTFGEINEFFIGCRNPMVVHFPPGVYHGFKCVGEEEALVINVPTHVYVYADPDEYRIEPHHNDIPYDWARKDG